MSRVAKPAGPEIDLRASPAASAGVQMVRALKTVAMGETVSIVSPNAAVTSEIIARVKATGQTLIAAIPFDGYVRLVVRRRR